MTTLVSTARQLPGRTTGTIRPQRFSRLINVEIRKMLDTRSGKAVLGLALGLTVIGLVWMLIRDPDKTPAWAHYVVVMQVGGMVLPVVGLLGMTAEWTQRTALTTFTLSPRRGRVLAAKFVGSLMVVAVTFAVLISLIVGAVLIASMISGEAANFDHFGASLRSQAITTVLQVTMAAGFGALAAQTAVAVGSYFVAPTAVTLIGVGLLNDNSRWIDVFGAYDRLASTQPWSGWPQTLTSVTLWIVLPATIGVIRSLKREVK